MSETLESVATKWIKSSIGIAEFTWQAGDLTFTGIALRSIATLVVYHGMRLASRRNPAVAVS